jgi:GxxExxY protein
MNENEISYLVRGSIYKVYNSLGPGLLESVYEAALMYELDLAGLEAKNQVPIPVVYNDLRLELGFKADIIVNNLVLIEIKSIESVAEVHHKQVITYIKLTNLKLGLLVNFNTVDIKHSIIRKVNNL